MSAVSSEQANIHGSRAATVRQHHTPDDIAFALDDILARTQQLPTVEEIQSLTSANSRHEVLILRRFFTRLSGEHPKD